MNGGREGFTTGTCAAAAAQAAVRLATHGDVLNQVTIELPRGDLVSLPVRRLRSIPGGAEAMIRKDAGDDPDVTHGVDVVVRVERSQQAEIELVAGSGVGVVTRPGLAVAPGQPAINPVPRRMIQGEIRRVTRQGVRVTVSIPGGEVLANKTCNARLGVVGGLSILGSTGRVRPFSTRALLETVSCSFAVARACGVRRPVLVPGHLGERAAHRHFRLGEGQVIEVGNAWGHALDQLRTWCGGQVLLVGHPGKLGKLAHDHWDTHSRNSPSPLLGLHLFLKEIGVDTPSDVRTVEGLFAAVPDSMRQLLARHVGIQVRDRVSARLGRRWAVSVVLIDLQERMLGSAGGLAPWI